MNSIGITTRSDYAQSVATNLPVTCLSTEPGHIIRTVLREGDVFLDVGAQNGVSSTLVAARTVGDAGRVLAMEPNPVKFARLLQNVALNRATNTMCFPVAASDETIYATLFCELPQDHTPSSGHNIRVQRADALCAKLGYGRVRMAKIDAPNAELLVLRGMSKMLSDDNGPYVLCQISKWTTASLASGRESLINFMSDFGYAVKQIGPTCVTRMPVGSPLVRLTLWFHKAYMPHALSR